MEYKLETLSWDIKENIEWHKTHQKILWKIEATISSGNSEQHLP